MSKIAFLLGAGASRQYGVPTMAGFYASFRGNLKTRRPGLYALLERLEKGSSASTPDLETLLSDLQLAASTEAGLRLLGVEPKDTLPSEQLDELRGALDAFIVDTCERFEREKSAEELKALLEASSAGPLWIFTTNYDRLVEHACEQHGIAFSDGFQGGIGQPVADYVGDFTEQVRIVKLHGSVNWFQDSPGGGLHRLDRGYPLPTKDFSLVRGDQRLKPLMIIPTLEKQVFDKPYSTLVARLGDVLRECHLLVVIGNSLRDRHLLSQITERMPQMQVLMMSPSASKALNALNLGDGSHAMDVGFRELLTTSGGDLLALCEAVHAAADRDTVTAAIAVFMTSVSDNAGAVASLRAHPELAQHDAMLSSASVAARARAADALGAFAHPGVVHRLGALLDGDAAAAVRAAAAGALLRIGTHEAMTRALKGLRDSDASVQLEVLTGVLSEREESRVARAIAEAMPNLKTPALNVLQRASKTTVTSSRTRVASESGPSDGPASSAAPLGS